MSSPATWALLAYTHNYSEISRNPAGHPNNIQVVTNHLTGFALQISDEFVYSILQQAQRRWKQGWLICCATAKETECSCIWDKPRVNKQHHHINQPLIRNDTGCSPVFSARQETVRSELMAILISPFCFCGCQWHPEHEEIKPQDLPHPVCSHGPPTLGHGPCLHEVMTADPWDTQCEIQNTKAPELSAFSNLWQQLRTSSAFVLYFRVWNTEGWFLLCWASFRLGCHHVTDRHLHQRSRKQLPHAAWTPCPEACQRRVGH